MLNRIFIMGRIGREIEKKTTQSGVSVANFVVAVDRDFKNGDEKVTDWIECVAWRNTADFLEKFSGKGRMIVVVGSLQSRKWQDKDGNNRTSWEVQAENVYFADSKRNGNSTLSGDYVSNVVNGTQQTAGAPQFEEAEDSGELPW